MNIPHRPKGRSWLTMNDLSLKLDHYFPAWNTGKAVFFEQCVSAGRKEGGSWRTAIKTW